MLHTNSFEIAIPKDFLKGDTPNRDKWDNVFKVLVNYSCKVDGSEMQIDQVQSNFHAAKYIKWDAPLLERHLLDAAHNNWESQYKPEVEIILDEENAKTLHY